MSKQRFLFSGNRTGSIPSLKVNSILEARVLCDGHRSQKLLTRNNNLYWQVWTSVWIQFSRPRRCCWISGHYWKLVTGRASSTGLSQQLSKLDLGLVGFSRKGLAEMGKPHDHMMISDCGPWLTSQSATDTIIKHITYKCYATKLKLEKNFQNVLSCNMLGPV